MYEPFNEFNRASIYFDTQFEDLQPPFTFELFTFCPQQLKESSVPMSYYKIVAFTSIELFPVLDFKHECHVILHFQFYKISFSLLTQMLSLYPANTSCEMEIYSPRQDSTHTPLGTLHLSHEPCQTDMFSEVEKHKGTHAGITHAPT